MSEEVALHSIRFEKINPFIDMISNAFIFSLLIVDKILQVICKKKKEGQMSLRMPLIYSKSGSVITALPPPNIDEDVPSTD